MFDTTAQSADTSAENKCTITPLNSTNLTVSDGVLSITYGLKNVRIQCNCSAASGMILRPIRWFDPHGRTIEKNNETVLDYFTENSGDRNVVLVIPIFNESHEGIYSCGFGNNFLTKQSINVDLAISKWLRIIIISTLAIWNSLFSVFNLCMKAFKGYDILSSSMHEEIHENAETH